MSVYISFIRYSQKLKATKCLSVGMDKQNIQCNMYSSSIKMNGRLIHATVDDSHRHLVTKRDLAQKSTYYMVLLYGYLEWSSLGRLAMKGKENLC